MMCFVNKLMRVSTVYTLSLHVIIVMHYTTLFFILYFELLPYFIKFKLNPLSLQQVF